MQQPTEPYLVYLDTTTLVDLIVKSEERHLKAKRLLNIFQVNKNSGLLHLYTSALAVNEAYAIVYDYILKERHIPRPPKDYRRNIIPFHSEELRLARKSTTKFLNYLYLTTQFRYWPLPGRDTTEIWNLTMDVENETSVWIPDSLHLAIAISTGCSMLVTDDQTFLNKIEEVKTTFIAKFRKSIFSQIANLSAFTANGVERTPCVNCGRKKKRESAIGILHKLGY